VNPLTVLSKSIEQGLEYLGNTYKVWMGKTRRETEDQLWTTDGKKKRETPLGSNAHTG
jgi:hypothetical protein